MTLAGLDASVERFMVDHRVAWLTSVMRAVTHLGSAAWLAVLVAGVGLAYVVVRRTVRPLLFLAITFGGAAALAHLLKLAIGRHRPPPSGVVAHGASFPSGHATGAAAAFGAVAVVVLAGRAPPTRRAGWTVAMTIALAVAFSRVYLGVHWLTDVIGGLALGWGWLYVVARAESRLLRDPRGVEGGHLAQDPGGGLEQR